MDKPSPEPLLKAWERTRARSPFQKRSKKLGKSAGYTALRFETRCVGNNDPAFTDVEVSESGRLAVDVDLQMLSTAGHFFKGFDRRHRFLIKPRRPS